MKTFLLSCGILFLSATATAQIPGCLSAPNGQYPSGVFTPNCTGNPELIIDYAFTGEYSKVKLNADVAYEFSADPVEGTPAYLTIASENGSTVLASGSSKVSFTPTENTVVRFYTHLSNSCTSNDYEFTARRIKCSAVLTSYCTPILDCTDGAVIKRFKFADLEKSSTCSENGYADYSASIVNVKRGENYPMEVEIGFGWFEQSVSVWIDYNNDFLFSNDEFFYIGTVDQGVLTKNITIPTNLPDGDYRMRVRLATVGQAGATAGKACNVADTYGETEDYTLRVAGQLGVTEVAKNGVHVYPNPVQDQLNIASDREFKKATIISPAGSPVKIMTKTEKIDLKDLTPGVYLLQIEFADGTVVSKKIIKE